MFLKYEDIENVQLDHTSKCNLLCPQCARVSNGSVNPVVPITELTMSDYESIFTEKFCKQIKHVLHCGNYGDAIVSNTLVPSLEYLKSNGIEKITIITNGSARNINWWKNLTTILTGKKDKIVFSIDGLKDTNHLYRVNSNFEKIIENAKAFINAGGNARWDYLVFKHNEHQIEDAMKLAKQLGFKEFNVKKTARFINESNYKTGSSANLNKQLSTPINKKMQSNSINDFENIIEKYGTWTNYINLTSISCKYQKRKEIFIDFEARLWPCCWTAAPMFFVEKNNSQTRQIQKLFDQYGKNFNSLRHHSLSDVLNHSWFKNDLSKSWLGSTEDMIPKLITCGRTCGLKYEFSGGDNSNKEIHIL